MVNVGSTDRIVRIVVGLVLLAATFVPPLAGYFAGWGAWKWAVPVVGLVMLGTAFMRFCPAYTLIGVNTCPRQ